MAECEHCGVDVDVAYTCLFCQGIHCEDHRLPEDHDCRSVDALETHSTEAVDGDPYVEHAAGADPAQEVEAARPEDEGQGRSFAPKVDYTDAPDQSAGAAPSPDSGAVDLGDSGSETDTEEMVPISYWVAAAVLTLVLFAGVVYWLGGF
jgi:hypothetical protein